MHLCYLDARRAGMQASKKFGQMTDDKYNQPPTYSNLGQHHHFAQPQWEPRSGICATYHLDPMSKGLRKLIQAISVHLPLACTPPTALLHECLWDVSTLEECSQIPIREASVGREKQRTSLQPRKNKAVLGFRGLTLKVERMDPLNSFQPQWYLSRPRSGQPEWNRLRRSVLIISTVNLYTSILKTSTSPLLCFNTIPPSMVDVTFTCVHRIKLQVTAHYRKAGSGPKEKHKIEKSRNLFANSCGTQSFEHTGLVKGVSRTLCLEQHGKGPHYSQVLFLLGCSERTGSTQWRLFQWYGYSSPSSSNMRANIFKWHSVSSPSHPI